VFLMASKSSSFRAVLLKEPAKDSRARSVDCGEIRRMGAIVTYRFKSIPNPEGFASFQAAFRSHETFGPLLQQVADNKKMQKLGSACPQFCLVPSFMYSVVRSQVRSGLCQDVDILVSLDLDLQFRRLIRSLACMIDLPAVFSVSPSLPDSMSDRRSQCSAGESSVVSQNFRKLLHQHKASEQQVSESDDADISD
jgi:hypothetical protein